MRQCNKKIEIMSLALDVKVTTNICEKVLEKLSLSVTLVQSVNVINQM